MYILKALDITTRPRELYIRKCIAKNYTRHIILHWPATGKGERITVYPTAKVTLDGTNLTVTSSDGIVTRYKNIIVLKSIATPVDTLADYESYR